MLLGYPQTASDGRPEAIPVADRWHLMENASAAFLTAVRGSTRVVREAVGAKLVKLQMYGRAKLDLLRARLLGAL